MYGILKTAINSLALAEHEMFPLILYSNKFICIFSIFDQLPIRRVNQ